MSYFYIFFFFFYFFIMYSAHDEKILWNFTSDSENSNMVFGDKKYPLMRLLTSSEDISHSLVKEQKNQTKEEGWDVDINTRRFKNGKKISFFNCIEKLIELNKKQN